MASLTGNAINTSYQGLIKFDDNGTVDPTVLKQLSDGTGGSLPIQISQVQTKFQTSVDFTGATVTGLPVAEAGFVNGTGTNSLKQADTLTTSAANASQNSAIAIGNGAQAIGNETVAIGDFAEATNVGCLSIGQYAAATGLYASAWGRTAGAYSDGAVAFGQQATVPFTAPGGVAMGRQVQADLADTTHVRALKIVAPDGGTGGNGITFLSPNGTAGVVTLTDASELAVDGTPIGGGGGAAGLVADTGTGSQKSADAISDGNNSATGYRSIAIGSGNQANANIGVAIGNYTRAGSNAVAIGDNANTSLGATASSVSVGQGANAAQNAVALGKSAIANNTSAIAIGNSASASGLFTAAIGILSTASGVGAVAYGNQAKASGTNSTAIGPEAGYISGVALDGIGIGYRAGQGGAAGSISIGKNSAATATNAVALGLGVTAATANTATVNLLQIAGYATMNFADDTAAATGGIPLGGVYHTDGALKIRIA